MEARENQKLYGIEELSRILGLHPKTLARFLREGKIKGRKIGRSWKVTHHDLAEYAHLELKQEEKKGELPVGDIGSRISVSTVIEIADGNSTEASRISNAIVAMLNCKDPSWGNSRYDFFYDKESRKSRFVFYGSSRFIKVVLNMFETLSEGIMEEQI